MPLVLPEDLDPPERDWGFCATPELAVKCVGQGWKDLVLRCFQILEESGRPYKIDQVKEKFGGLRFYFSFLPFDRPTNHDDRATWDRISAAEAESYKTCEECGSPGSFALLGGSWRKTLCNACVAKNKDASRPGELAPDDDEF